MSAASPTTPSSPPHSSNHAALDDHQLTEAWLAAREELLAERNPQGYWVGELSSSPLATATAISALSVAERESTHLSCLHSNQEDQEASELWNIAYRSDLSELICTSVRWLAEQQNEDGGWGDTDRSDSNLATTMLVVSAFRMTGTPAKYSDLEPRAEQYIREQGGVAGLKKRYSRDRTVAAPILTNCALAGMIPWSKTPVLPFELAAAPASWHRLLRLPVVSYAVPTLVAMGLARHYHQPSANPFTRWLRSLVTEKCLAMVAKMQPDSGGFLEATPLTSFVVMALASTGRSNHAIVRRGVEFLLASVRPDGSWAIDENLATRNTTLAANALHKGEELRGADCVARVERSPNPQFPTNDSKLKTLDWLLACQHTQEHPFTGAEAGGWAWTNLSGGAPNAADTSGALLALQGYWRNAEGPQQRRIAAAAGGGVRWLLDLQNGNGGWPPFCRGGGKLPFDRSTTDLTAHTLRALHAWRQTRGWWTAAAQSRPSSGKLASADLDRRIDTALASGLQFLSEQQADDGSWPPLWSGSDRRQGEKNQVFGTARVLQTLAEVAGTDSSLAAAGLEWLVGQQHKEGAWGADPKSKLPLPSVEETAVAIEALLPWGVGDLRISKAVDRGVRWLAEAVTRGLLDEPAPVGLSFAKLWYYERLYPKSFAVSALGAALQQRVASKPQWGEDTPTANNSAVASIATATA